MGWEFPPLPFFPDNPFAKLVPLPLWVLGSFCLWYYLCTVHRFTNTFLWVYESVAKSACSDTNWQKILKLAVCPLSLLILLTLSVHLLRKYRGSFSHKWRITLAMFKSFMYCMSVMAFLACSRIIQNSCSPVPSLGLTAGQLDSLVMYALVWVTKMFLQKPSSLLVPIIAFNSFVKKPFISSFAFLLVYWSKKYKRSLESSTLDSMRVSTAV